MKKGKEITIIPSFALTYMRLEGLSGRNAIVTEINKTESGEIKGCWVELIGCPFRGEQEWYVPYISIS